MKLKINKHADEVIFFISNIKYPAMGKGKF